MAVQIQWRRDTAAHWTAADPTLAEGELGYETDTGKLKVGDGSTAWTGLAYFLGTVIDIGTPNDGELHLTPKSSSTGAEGTVYYDSDDNYVYVATE